MKRVWQCDSCGKVDATSQPWNCPTCGSETCEHCFDSFAHCKRCAATLDRLTMIRRANAHGCDFDEKEATDGK